MDFQKSFLAATQQAKSIVITTHTLPDADGIGSQLGLCLGLREAHKNVFCVNEEALPERYQYLDQLALIQSADQFSKINKNNSELEQDLVIDLLIVVDTNTTERIGVKVAKLITEKTKIIYIDHHPYQRLLGDGHLVDPTAAATGQLVSELLDALEIQMTPQLALPLYTAILIDTNSFRYPTVNHRTHQVVSNLLKTGISPSGAYNKIYGTKTIAHTHFLAEVLRNSQCQSGIAWMHITKELQDKYKISAEESNAFINHLLVLDNIKVACMFREDEDNIKLSLRSHGQIDVGEIAKALGGGGHSHAAATRFKLQKSSDQTKELIKTTIEKIESLLTSR